MSLIDITHAPISRLRLGPRDVVVIKCPGALSPLQMDAAIAVVKDSLGRAGYDNEVLMLTQGASLEILGADDEEE